VNEREKLKTLLRHWQEHNHEHAEVYHEWSKKASESGDEELSRILVSLYHETRKLDELFQEARKIA
jgi:hypothetical protein